MALRRSLKCHGRHRSLSSTSAEYRADGERGTCTHRRWAAGPVSRRRPIQSRLGTFADGVSLIEPVQPAWRAGVCAGSGSGGCGNWHSWCSECVSPKRKTRSVSIAGPRAALPGSVPGCADTGGNDKALVRFARPQHWGSSGRNALTRRRTFSSGVAGSERCPGDLPTLKFEAIGASAAGGLHIGRGTRFKYDLDRHRYQSCAAKENLLIPDSHPATRMR